MGRKPIGSKALTNAEKQKRYRKTTDRRRYYGKAQIEQCLWHLVDLLAENPPETIRKHAIAAKESLEIWLRCQSTDPVELAEAAQNARTAIPLSNAIDKLRAVGAEIVKHRNGEITVEEVRGSPEEVFRAYCTMHSPTFIVYTQCGMVAHDRSGRFAPGDQLPGASCEIAGAGEAD
jgi:hypothetical protein